jgi:hypothetical protein
MATHHVCEICGVAGARFHLHHRSYFHAGDGHELDSDLALLCSDCHVMVHRLAETSNGRYNIDTGVDALRSLFYPAPSAPPPLSRNQRQSRQDRLNAAKLFEDVDDD